MAITVALLGLAAASYPLYLASSASGALAVEIAQRCPDGLDAAVTASGSTSGVAAATSSLATKSNNALVASGTRSVDLGRSIVTLDETGIGVGLAGGHPTQQFAQLASRTDGLENITVLSSAGGSGVWLSDDVAQSIGAKAGDLVTLRQDPQASDPHPSPGAPSAEVRVAGIYASLVGNRPARGSGAARPRSSVLPTTTSHPRRSSSHRRA